MITEAKIRKAAGKMKESICEIDPEFEEKHGRTVSEAKDLVEHFKNNKQGLVDLVDNLLDDADYYMESALLYDVEHCNQGRQRLALAQYIVVNYLTEK